jgi:hypothetical protein
MYRVCKQTQTRNTKIKHEQTNSDLVTYILLLYNTFTFLYVNKHRLVKQKFKHEQTKTDLMTFKCLLTTTSNIHIIMSRQILTS